MRPADFANKHTLEFIEREVDVPGRRFLEVGCGLGDLAEALQARGANLVAIDRSAAAVETARFKGVNAFEMDFLQYDRIGEPFDCILFVRSLHHIHPVKTAVALAALLLAAPGKVIVEDFAAEDMDEPALAWARQMDASIADSLRAQSDRPHHFPMESLEVWRAHHFVNHDVLPATSYVPALEAQLSNVRMVRVPYIYRYFVDRLVPTAQGVDKLMEIFDSEQQAVQSGKIPAIGVRIVGEQQPVD